MTPEQYGQVLGKIGPAILSVLTSMETAMRFLHPPVIAKLRESMAPVLEQFDAAQAEFEQIEPPPEIAEVHTQLSRCVECTGRACHLFCDDSAGPDATLRILEAMRQHARAQEALYPLRNAAPPFAHFFAEKHVHEQIEQLDPEPRQGISVGLHASGSGDDSERGGFSFYVPETYDGTRDWPLVVALHGGSGNGRDFIWTWLREARSRKFLLLAPTSLGSTWSFNGPDVDGSALKSIVEHIGETWRIDRTRILLTGLSDGATYSLFSGLAEGSIFTNLAPVSGVLHPANLSNGNLTRAVNRPIYLTHDALDWMFPVQVAQMARDELEKAGAQLVYREIENLSHTYPREENGRIIEWFLGAN